MMILAALLVLPTSAPVRVATSDPSEVVLCVAAPLPKLGSRDRELLVIGMEALAKGSQVYPPSKIRAVTEGRGIAVRLLEDEALVTVTVPAGSAGVGTDLLSSLMREPSFEQEDLDAALQRQLGRTRGYWDSAMLPPIILPKKALHDEVLQVFDRVFRPDKVQMAYGGPSEGSEVDSKWALRTSDWTPAPEPRYPDLDLAPAPTSYPGHLTTADLIGPEIAANEPALPARLLALYALGSGKGGSLFRIARGRHAWSYRQEAYLWPRAGGWEPRLFLTMVPVPDAQTRIETLRKELQADADSWTDDDRLRALGMAESTLLRGLPYGPILLGDSPLCLRPEDQVTMAAYWKVKTGSTWDPQDLYQSMSKVSLSDLKASAHAILDPARIVVLPGT